MPRRVFASRRRYGMPLRRRPSRHLGQAFDLLEQQFALPVDVADEHERGRARTWPAGYGSAETSDPHAATGGVDSSAEVFIDAREDLVEQLCRWTRSAEVPNS